jgi:hypothetical protein
MTDVLHPNGDTAAGGGGRGTGQQPIQAPHAGPHPERRPRRRGQCGPCTSSFVASLVVSCVRVPPSPQIRYVCSRANTHAGGDSEGFDQWAVPPDALPKCLAEREGQAARRRPSRPLGRPRGGPQCRSSASTRPSPTGLPRRTDRGALIERGEAAVFTTNTRNTHTRLLTKQLLPARAQAAMPHAKRLKQEPGRVGGTAMRPGASRTSTATRPTAGTRTTAGASPVPPSSAVLRARASDCC